MFASSKLETVHAISESAIGPSKTAGSETAQNTRDTSQSVSHISSTVNSQIRTLEPSKSSISMIDNSSYLLTFFKSNQYYLIALGCLLMVLTCCCLYYLYRSRRRRNISKGSTFSNSTVQTTSSNSNTTNRTTNSLYSASYYSTSMSNTSSSQNSDYPQNQTMSMTLASKELGNLICLFS
jgi:hypothetical protein